MKLIYWVKLLLFSGAIAGSEAVFGEPTLPVVLSLVNCTGLEERLVDCPSSNDTECGQFDDADVVCQGYCNNSTMNIGIPV